MDEHYEAKAGFGAHWERVELGRGPNRDGVVRITQPSRKATNQAKAAKTPKAAKRAAVTIRVIRAY